MESQWRRLGDSEVFDVKVFNNCISFDNKYMPFTFDIRFMISDDKITFLENENDISFELVQKDKICWRNVLKQFLNQTGFH